MSGETWLIVGFLLPTLAFLIFLLWLPFLQGIWMSFHHWPFFGEPKWEGLENYREFLSADYFWTTLRSTAIYSLSTVVQLGIALIAALALNQKFIRLKSLWSGIVIVPFVMPPVVGGAIWLYLLDPDLGMAMYYLQEFGILDEPVYWDVEPFSANIVITLVAAWTFWPFMFLLIFASLQSIPESYHELAEVYGANLWQRFWMVTLPHIKGAILTAVTIRFVWNLAKIDQPYQLTGGGPGYDTSVLSILTYQFAYGYGDFGKAFTVGVFLVLFTAVVIGPFLKKFHSQISDTGR
tara:strand:+ start:3962 stop:4840 length:879 start_codon:yes stop_codon:yes gene_type:complete